MTNTVGIETENTEGGTGTVSDLIHGRIAPQEFVDGSGVTPAQLAEDLKMLLGTPEILFTGAKGEGVRLSQVMQSFLACLVICAPDDEAVPIVQNQITSLLYLSGEVSTEEYFASEEFAEEDNVRLLITETQNQLDNPVSLMMLAMVQEVEPETVFAKMGELVTAGEAKLA